MRARIPSSATGNAAARMLEEKIRKAKETLEPEYMPKGHRPSINDLAVYLEQMGSNAGTPANTAKTQLTETLQNLRAGITAIVTMLRVSDISVVATAAAEAARVEIVKVTEDAMESCAINVHESFSTFETYWEEKAKVFTDKVEEQVVRIEELTKRLAEREDTTPQTTQSSGGTAVPTMAQIVASQAKLHPSRAEHQRIIDQIARLENQVVLRPDDFADPMELDGLTAPVLTLKGNEAIEAIKADNPDAPRDMQFIGASRSKGNCIMLQINNREAAKWIRRHVHLLSEKLGTSKLRPVVTEVLVKWVPIAVDLNDPEVPRKLEKDNGLEAGDIYSVRWLKKPEMRHEAQRTAFAMVGCMSAEAANALMRADVMYFMGSTLPTSVPEPTVKRCTKCQKLGTSHSSATCKHEHDVCARCSGRHRTKECILTDPSKFKCPNCDGPHTAADRRCRVFQRKMDDQRRSNPRAKYLRYPTDDPATWQTRDLPPRIRESPPDEDGYQ